MTAAPSRLELALDGCTSPTVGPRKWGAYFVCGMVGYVTGTVLSAVLARAAGFGLGARLVVALVPPVSLLLAIKASQIVFGRERIVFLEKAIVAVLVSAGVAAIAGAPVGRTIDLVTLGVGTFLACGRIGCFRVACCHGRRARRGVRYRHEHAAAGFPVRWVGVPIVPLQLADAALSAAFVALGTVLVWRGAAPGIATAAYVAGYGVGRTGLELLRGDPARPLAGGVTEAQWTALVVMIAVAIWHPTAWTIAPAAVVAIVIAALFVARRTGAFDRLWLASAWHADEVDRLVHGLVAGGAPVTTREGLKLSCAPLPDGRIDVIVSRTERPPSPAAVRALAGQLGHPWLEPEIVAGRTPGLYHVLFKR